MLNITCGLPTDFTEPPCISWHTVAYISIDKIETSTINTGRTGTLIDVFKRKPNTH